jgi:hypothetical protein
VTVYVDPLASWGWKLRGRVVQSCHLFTDEVDLVELHRFAAIIGMRRDWFQDARSAPHYDLTPRRREHAVRLGAVEVSRARAVEIWRARRKLLQVAR